MILFFGFVVSACLFGIAESLRSVFSVYEVKLVPTEEGPLYKAGSAHHCCCHSVEYPNYGGHLWE